MTNKVTTWVIQAVLWAKTTDPETSEETWDMLD